MTQITLDDLQRHPMYTPSDLAYFHSKGYSSEEIIAFWDRDLGDGHEPLHHKAAPQIVEHILRPDLN